MVQAPGAAADGLEFAADRIAMNIHGNADSHIDALCHVAFDGILYNGVPASAVTAAGAVELSIAIAADGIAGRGVLLDVPRLRGVPWLDPATTSHRRHHRRRAGDQGVRISQGRHPARPGGAQRRRKECGAWDAAATRAGLHPSVLPLLAERQDRRARQRRQQRHRAQRAEASTSRCTCSPINALGLMLLDYLQFDGAGRCARRPGAGRSCASSRRCGCRPGRGRR
jgi:hypothetical protein